MQRKMRWLLLILVLLGLSWSQSASAALTARKISGNMPSFGDVSVDAPTAPQFTRNGTYMMYVANQRLADTFELFRAPVYTGGAPVLMSNWVQAGSRVVAFAMASNRQELVYLISTPTPGAQRLLYRVAVSGPPSVQLGGPSITGNVVDFKLSRSAGNVVFRARPNTNDELYHTPMGGGPTTHLSSYNVRTYQITPDSMQVVFMAYLDEDEDPALLSVPIHGGTIVRVGNDSPHLYDVGGTFYITTNSQRVVFFGQSTILGPDDIYSAPVTGGAATRLNAPLASGGDVAYAAAISPDNNLVVFRADQEGDGTYDLYTVPIGGGTPIKISNLPDAALRVEDDFRFSPDNAYVIYRADQQTDDYVELFRAPVGGGAITLLSGGLPTGRGVKQFDFTPDGNTVVFQGEHIWSYDDHLYSVPIDASSAPVDLLATMGDAGDADAFAISPDGSYVAFVGFWGSDAQRSLYRVRLDGSGLVRLNGNMPDDGMGVYGFWIDPGGVAVGYGADAEVQGRMELYVAYDESKTYMPFVAR